MKTKTFIIFLFVTLASASCTPKNVPMADNFSFIFEEYACGSSRLLNVLDTSTGILIHTPLDEYESIAIPFTLSENELETIYQKIISSNYFNYPSEVRILGEIPGSTFRLEVVNGVFTNDVKWTSTDPETNFPKYDDLLELYILIQQIIHSHPEYPEPNSACV